MNKPEHPLIDGVYLECREGWYNIIQVLCEALEDQSKRFGAPVPRVRQVKEKFGTLRFYVDQSSAAQDALIYMAVELSGCTCEVCGRPGQRRATGWTKTLCDEHAPEPEPPL